MKTDRRKTREAEEEEDIEARLAWFNRFKVRSHLCKTPALGEAASTDTIAYV